MKLYKYSLIFFTVLLKIKSSGTYAAYTVSMIVFLAVWEKKIHKTKFISSNSNRMRWIKEKHRMKKSQIRMHAKEH